jgi:hypothetical protein
LPAAGREGSEDKVNQPFKKAIWAGRAKVSLVLYPPDAIELLNIEFCDPCG